MWDSPLAESFPLLEMILGLASGIVVHSQYAEAKVRPGFDGPILRLALPWDQKPSLSDEEIAHWASETRSTKRCVFTSFGHIGRTKNLHRAIQAFIVRPELAEIARFAIVGFPGDPAYLEDLQRMVRSQYLEDCVSFELSVTDQRLHQCKLEADVFINTRSPITESASGSLTEQLNAAKPAIVFSSGPYAEIPDDAVVKLDPNCSDETLADAMLAMAKDAERRIATGSAGLSYVRRISAADYLHQLKKFLVAEEPALKRRQRFRVPIKKSNPWTTDDVVTEDRAWFASLTKCRSLWNAIDFDPAGLSPAPMLEWEPASAVRYGVAVILGVDPAPATEATVSSLHASIGAWETYRLLQLVRSKLVLVRAKSAPTILEARDQRLVPSAAFWRIAVHFEPLVLARLCFVALLGRVWHEGEDAVWAAMFECCANPKAVIERFLDSYGETDGTSGAHLEPVREWCREEDEGASERLARPRGAFQWPVGAKLEFDRANAQSAGLLTGQWFAPEPEGRWMGRFGALRFEPATAISEDLELEITCRIAASKEAGPGLLKIMSSGGYTGNTLIQDDMRTRFTVPIPAAASGRTPIAVTFEISRTACMKALKLGADTRELGLMLFSATLKPGPANAVSDPPRSRGTSRTEDDDVFGEHSVTPFPRARA